MQVGTGVTAADYDLTDAANNLVLNISSYVFSAEAGNSQGLSMSVGDGPPSVGYNGDSLQIAAARGFNGVLSTNYSGMNLDLIAVSFGGDLNFLTSTAIPDPFNLADLWLNSPYTTFGVQTDDGVSKSFLNGVLTNASVSETPEPKALWLLGIGLILVGVPRGYLYPRLPEPNKLPS